MAYQAELFEGDWTILYGEQDFDDPAASTVTLIGGMVCEGNAEIGTYAVDDQGIMIRLQDPASSALHFRTMVGEQFSRDTKMLSGTVNYTFEDSDELYVEPATLYRAEALSMLKAA